MRLSTIVHEGRRRLVIAEGPGEEWRLAPGHLRLEDVIAGAPIPVGGASPTVDEVVPVLPHRPGTIFGIGLNYLDTIAEMGWQRSEAPYLFTKLSSSAIGTGEAIVVDTTVTRRVDWETELAVVIGAEARDIPESEALDVVFGYTVANDVSARDLQADDGQWVRGKGLDTFCPLGPAVITADEIEDPQRLAVRTWVNGEKVQDGTTADMVFSVRSLIAYLSRFFTLRPGDVILTGTPSGCGDFMDPPRALCPGDTVISEVEGIGRLVNPVRAAGE
jgi:2-keto-4-pentenoate hydratase/2-oxohepta-3-ene-1,7-dioic acid hydratase in catechol pathway